VYVIGGTNENGWMDTVEEYTVDKGGVVLPNTIGPYSGAFAAVAIGEKYKF
jgi:hypothetical protein